MKKILSIIIPYYNTQKYTDELLSVLNAQMSEDIEVILVDDGSPEPFKTDYPWLKIIRQDHAGSSTARNAGLDTAAGDYIAFIDSDDLVSKDYLQNIKDQAQKGADYIELTWKSLTTSGMQFNCKVTNTEPLRNPSVCTRVFKRSFIGTIRFNVNKDIAEDEDFTRHLDLSRGSRDFISSYMYYYRTDRVNSKSKEYRRGLSKTKRIVYYVPVVDPGRADLLEEIRELDEQNEVILFCNENHIPELSKYCQISKPFKIWAHELRGEPCWLVEIMKQPLKTQVLIYIDTVSGFDGIFTFMHNFCVQMRSYYDIAVLHDNLGARQINRLRPLVRVVKSGEYPVIICDTLLMMRIRAEIPKDVQYKQLYQVVHCTHDVTRELIRNPEQCIFVSETAQQSFNTDKGRVIYNLSNPEKPQKSLMLISTTRIGARDKGDQNKQMLRLAQQLHDQQINFIWLYFSENKLIGAPENMIRVDPVPDVRDYLRHADYLVHLSENEAYCYSITEALSMGVPVIALDIPVLHELGFKDKKHGYILRDDMDFKKLLSVPRFKAFHITDDERAVSSWCNLLGDSVPLHDYTPEARVMVKVIDTYKDMELDRVLSPGEVLDMWRDRAEHLKELNLVEILEG